MTGDDTAAGTGPVLDLHERPGPGLWAALSLQHLFAMFGATILVPLLTGLSPAWRWPPWSAWCSTW